ncbi:hypothetical protein PMZ80_007992 [Knufia obscura]|uniref:Cutinase n=1 Tax=Knufia obscura TaxID=1635080 RepID=A0ABR0RG65_9EURO|nr:hypothetical protein PMZ80_007992 [Knufia obscura]
MKYTFALSALAALASAGPILGETAAPIEDLETRQLGSVGVTANEFSGLLGSVNCRDVIFFFARGSTEAGNLGTVIGPDVGNGLKRVFGSTNVAVEGIDYPALLSTNNLPGGADLGGIREMEDLLDSAASRCPNSKIVVGGYSQGAALVHRAVEDRSTAVKNKIVGAVTFGDTKNLQDGRQIPNFPREKTRIFCAVGDLVCTGSLIITAAHLTYGANAAEAVAFLAARIRA